MRTDGTIYQKMLFLILEILLKTSYGENYLPKGPNNYSGKKAKNAQEAHEAIRPTDIYKNT